MQFAEEGAYGGAQIMGSHLEAEERNSLTLVLDVMKCDLEGDFGAEGGIDSLLV